MIIGHAGSRIQWAIRVEAFGAPICHQGKQVGGGVALHPLCIGMGAKVGLWI